MPASDHFTTTFPHSFFNIASHFFLRYPNPSSRHVISVDTIHSAVTNGKLYTTRILLKRESAESSEWIRRMIGKGEGYVLEQSIIDPANKTIETYIRNLSFPRIMLVEENQLYKLDNETQMLVESDVKVTSSLRFLTRRIEEYGLQRWKNAFEPVKKSPTYYTKV